MPTNSKQLIEKKKVFKHTQEGAGEGGKEKEKERESGEGGKKGRDRVSQNGRWRGAFSTVSSSAPSRLWSLKEYLTRRKLMDRTSQSCYVNNRGILILL